MQDAESDFAPSEEGSSEDDDSDVEYEDEIDSEDAASEGEEETGSEESEGKDFDELEVIKLNLRLAFHIEICM